MNCLQQYQWQIIIAYQEVCSEINGMQSIQILKKVALETVEGCFCILWSYYKK